MFTLLKQGSPLLLWGAIVAALTPTTIRQPIATGIADWWLPALLLMLLAALFLAGARFVRANLRSDVCAPRARVGQEVFRA